MPYHISAIDNGRGMYCRGSGQMLGREVFAAMSKAHAEWRGKLDYILIDLREVEAAISTPEERRAILDLEIALSRRYPNLVLVGIATTELQFGLARMWEQMLEPTKWSVEATLGAAAAFEALQAHLAARGLPPAAPIN